MSGRVIPDYFKAHTACCRVQKFEESGCKVPLPRGKESVTLSGTLLQRNHSIAGNLCDLLMYEGTSTGKSRISAAEAKSGSVSASHVHAQLQAGADIIQSEVSPEEYHSFTVNLVHRTMKTVELRHFRRLKVRFHGRLYPIRLVKCGQMIPD